MEEVEGFFRLKCMIQVVGVVGGLCFYFFYSCGRRWRGDGE